MDKLSPVCSGTSNSDILKCLLGLLTLGKNDFECIETFRGDDFFQHALGLFHIPSCSTLRQRLDAYAKDWFELMPALNHQLLSSRIAGKLIDFGILPCGYTPIDCDTFAVDIGSYPEFLLWPVGTALCETVLTIQRSPHSACLVLPE